MSKAECSGTGSSDRLDNVKSTSDFIVSGWFRPSLRFIQRSNQTDIGDTIMIEEHRFYFVMKAALNCTFVQGACIAQVFELALLHTCI